MSGSPSCVLRALCVLAVSFALVPAVSAQPLPSFTAAGSGGFGTCTIITLVESRGLFQRALERHDIDIDGRGVEGDEVAVESQARRGGGGQGPPEREDRLAEVVPRGLFAGPAPEQGGQLVARMGTAKRQRQIGEQGPGLLGRQAGGAARIQPGLKAAQKSEAQPRRGCRARPYHLLTQLLTRASTDP